MISPVGRCIIPVSWVMILFLCLLGGCVEDDPSTCSGQADDDSLDDDDTASPGDDDAGDDDFFTDDDADDDSDDDHDGPWEDYEDVISAGDGINLYTKVFLPEPDSENGVPAVLCRTPYRLSIAEGEYEKRAQVFVDLGMAFVLQDCRGRGLSEGEFLPYVNEIADGRATTEWIAQQYWSNDEIGSFGASYDAYAAVAAAVDNPLVKAVAAEEPARGDVGPRQDDGAASKARLDWLYTLKYGEWMPDDLIIQATNMLDVAGADQAVVGESCDYWQKYVEAPDPSGDTWRQNVLDDELAQVCAPSLILYSMEFQWSDPVDAWRGLSENDCGRAGDHRLVVGPEAHGYHTYTLPYFETAANKLMVDYMRAFLLGEDVGLEQAPAVQFRAEDEDDAHAADSWPPPSETLTLYLDMSGSFGQLSETNALNEAPDDIYADPAENDPCADDHAVEKYYSALLDEGLYIAGTPEAVIYFSSTTPDADLFLDLKEVSLLGHERLIGTAQLRARYRDGGDELLDSGVIYEADMAMFPAAFAVGANSRLALEIRPAHCGYFENPHTAEAFNAQTHWESSTLTIHHDDAHPSRISIPVLAGK